jgi:hypothetical protein
MTSKAFEYHVIIEKLGSWQHHVKRIFEDEKAFDLSLMPEVLRESSRELKISHR